jgi:hypothetical protein
MKINIHLWSYLFLEREMFQTKFVGKSKHKIFVQQTLFFRISFPPYEIIWKDIVEPFRPQMTIWHIRIAFWEPKATNTHSDYAILTAFPREQWLHEHASMLRYTYIVSLVSYQVLFTSSAPLCLPNGPYVIHLDLIALTIGLFDEEYTSRNLLLRNFLCPIITFYLSGPSMRAVRKVKNVWVYNPRSCFIVLDQSFGVFSRV